MEKDPKFSLLMFKMENFGVTKYGKINQMEEYLKKKMKKKCNSV